MKKKYEIKKTIAKMVWSTIEIVIAGALYMYSGQPALLATAPILHGIRNYVKHKK